MRHVRVEQVLGAPPQDLTWVHVTALVTAAVAEGDTVDFKAEHYGNSDKDRFELAKDVTSLANAAGGVLLLGVAEAEGAAAGLPGVALDDGTQTRYRQIIGSLVFPLPDVNLHPIPGPDGDGAGVLVIEVTRSPFAPHAVAQSNGTLRYPQRHGTTTRYLSEPEVADAYRARQLLGESRVELLTLREAAFLETLDGSEPWLVLVAVPDLPGYSPVDRVAFNAFRDRIVGRKAGLAWMSPWTFTEVRAGHRRLVATGGTSKAAGWEGKATWVAAEFHADGSGTFAIRLADLLARRESWQPEPDHASVLDLHVASALLAGLGHLGAHANAAGAAGMLNTRAQVWPVSATRPVSLGHMGFMGTRDEHGPALVTAPVTDLAIPIMDLADGPELVAAAALLLRDTGQLFGVPELGMLSTDGSVRRRYWPQTTHAELGRWCATNRVPVSDDVLP